MVQNKTTYFQHLGKRDYQEVWDIQEGIFQKSVQTKLHNKRHNIVQANPNYLLFCEHPHVYTLGKSGSMNHLLLSDKHLKSKNASFYKINRGGDITYHGLGQLVGYPIFDLDNFFNDLHEYMRLLEEVIILTLADYDLEGKRIDGLTGVWLTNASGENPRKICAMGVRCSQWVTMHGFALNVNTDLSYFQHIVPCGISDKAVTSLQNELDRAVNMQDVEQSVLKHLTNCFGLDLIECEVC